MAMQAFAKFVRSRKVSTSHDATHLVFDRDPRIMPGKFRIDDADQDEFERVYIDAVRAKGSLDCAIVETRAGLDRAPVVFDLDFHTMETTRMYTFEHIERFVENVVDVLSQLVEVPDEYTIVVSEKASPTIIGPTDAKDGFHVHIPAVVTEIPVQYSIRRVLLHRMSAIFPFDITNEKGFDDVLDHRIIQANGLILAGSRKAAGQVYDTTHTWTVASSAVIRHEQHTDRVASLVQFDIFQRSAARGSACKPTQHCLDEMALDTTLQQKPKRGRGRPRKDADATMEIPTENDVPVDPVRAPPLELVKAALGVIASRAEVYDEWLHIGFALASIVATKTDYDAVLSVWLGFSSTSAAKYPGDNIAADKFSGLISAWRAAAADGRIRVLTWRSLFYWASAEDTPEAKRVMAQYRAYVYLERTTDIEKGATHVVRHGDEAVHCQPFYWDKSSDKQSVIVVKANMGLGKTYQEIDFMKRHPDEKVLLFGTRRSYAKNVTDRLGLADVTVANYLDESCDVNAAQRVMTSVESAHKLQVSFAVVIVDEVEAFAAQLLSTTVKFLPECYAAILRILRNAKCVICLDAFPTSTGVGFVRAVTGGDAVVTTHVHAHQPFPRIYEVVAPEAGTKCKPHQVALLMFTEMIAALRSGKKIVFASASKRISDAFFAFLRKFHADLDERIRIKYYSSDTPDDQLFHDIQNIDTEWGGSDMVAFTNKLSVGVDFSLRNVFDQAFVYGSAASGQTGVDLIQQSFRVRHLRDPVVRVFYSLAICEHRPIGVEKIRAEGMVKRKSLAEQFRQHQRMVYHECDQEFQKELNLVFQSGRAVTKEEYDDIRSWHFRKLGGAPALLDTPETMQRLHESHEDNLAHWSMYYAPLFEQTVRRMGHEYRVRTVDIPAALAESDLDGLDIAQLVSDDDKMSSLYDSIPVLTDADFQTLCRKQERGKGSADDVLAIKKYLFNRQCDTFPCDTPSDKRGVVFAKIVTNKSDERMHVHHVVEFADHERMLQDISTYRPFADLVDSAQAAVGHVRTICSLLGLRDTFDVGRVVKRGVIERNLEALATECRAVIRIMRFRSRSASEAIDFDTVKALADCVLKSWTGTRLECTEHAPNRQIMTMEVSVDETVGAAVARVWLAQPTE